MAAVAAAAVVVAREAELVSAGVFRHYSHKPEQGHWQPGAASRFLSACGNARVERAAFSSTPSLSYCSIHVNPPMRVETSPVGQSSRLTPCFNEAAVTSGNPLSPWERLGEGCAAILSASLPSGRNDAPSGVLTRTRFASLATGFPFAIALLGMTICLSMRLRREAKRDRWMREASKDRNQSS